MNTLTRASLALSGSFLLACCAGSTPPPEKPKPAAQKPAAAPPPAPKEVIVMATDIEARLAKFTPTDIDFDESLLSPAQRKTVVRLVQAAEILDDIYLDQVSPDNRALRQKLVDQQAPQAALDYFDVMYGPWDRLLGDEPFIGTTPKPKGAGFYPPGLTDADLENFIRANPRQEAAVRGYFTVIQGQGVDLKVVPYSEAYKERLTQAARLLQAAAEQTDHAGLKRYLETRGAAFLSNDYYESDVAWMELGDSPIEVVLGPYEVYEDRLMGYKAAFEAFVTLRDPAYSKRLAVVAGFQDKLEANLPLPRKFHTRRGSSSPISVVSVIFTGGDTRAGVQTAAFNLPNDERVRTEKGSKKVLLKNHSEAKYNKVLLPIAREVVSEADNKNITFDAYFTDILLHEMAHGIGPGKIVVNGKPTEVNKELKDLYPSIEECKADIVGLINAQLLVKHKALPGEMLTQIPSAYLAGIFRAVRFGTEEAHARGVLLAFNYLQDKGAIVHDATTRRFAVNAKKFYGGARALAGELLMVQATGSYEGAKKLLDTYAVVRPELKDALSRVTGVPVDIRPRYTVLEKMKSW